MKNPFTKRPPAGQNGPTAADRPQAGPSEATAWPAWFVAFLVALGVIVVALIIFNVVGCTVEHSVTIAPLPASAASR